MARQLFSASELAELDLAYEEWKRSPAAAAAVARAKVRTGLKSIAEQLLGN